MSGGRRGCGFLFLVCFGGWFILWIDCGCFDVFGNLRILVDSSRKLYRVVYEKATYAELRILNDNLIETINLEVFSSK